MLDRLEAIKAKFQDIGVALGNPEIVNDNRKFGQMSKEYRSLEKIVNTRNAYVKLLDDIEFNKEVLNADDEEMRELAKQELPGMEATKDSMEKNLLPIFQNKVKLIFSELKESDAAILGASALVWELKG